MQLIFLVISNQESVDDEINYELPDDITPPPNRSFLSGQMAQQACRSVKTAGPKPTIPSNVPKPSPGNQFYFAQKNAKVIHLHRLLK